jgi:hypothetical protein
MKNAVVRDMTLCSLFKNRRFGGRYRFHLRDETRLMSYSSTVTDRQDIGGAAARGSLRRPSWGISSLRTSRIQNHFTLKIAVVCSSEISVLMRATRHHIPKDGVLRSQTNSVAFSPQANYTDWTTATCRRNLVPTFVDRRVSRGQRGRSPTVVNLSFLDRFFVATVAKTSNFTQNHC